MKAKDVKTIADLKAYLKQIGADVFVVADHPNLGSYECTVYDKNSKSRIKIHVVGRMKTGHPSLWYMNGFREDGTFWKFNKDICSNKEAICKVCWRLSRKVRKTA